jgi:hypothetical protein
MKLLQIQQKTNNHEIKLEDVEGFKCLLTEKTI